MYSKKKKKKFFLMHTPLVATVIDWITQWVGQSSHAPKVSPADRYLWTMAVKVRCPHTQEAMAGVWGLWMVDGLSEL